jgi:peptidyl-dipeptidase Dcp
MGACGLVHKDVASMQKIVDAEGGNFKISPWDYRYYSEKVRKEKYDLDRMWSRIPAIGKPQRGMFWVAGELFDLQFKR